MSQNNVSEVNMFSFEALNLHVVFPKVCFSERGWTPFFLLTFKIIISDIFPENSFEIPQLVLKIY